MNYKITNKNFLEISKCIIIGLLVIIGTFPENDWSFSTGVDSPLSWVYNYLFKNGLTQGIHIIFPHGPLAFFMYPLSETIILSTVVTSILKILLVINLFQITDFNSKNSESTWIITFVTAYIFSIIAIFSHLILANILLLYANYYNRKKWIYKFGAFFLTAFAFYIRSYVAILSGLITFSFLGYFIFVTRNYRKLSYDILTVLGLLLSFWFFMYGTLSGFIGYVNGIIHLAGDNSAAASYYPYNNWWILSIFLVIAFLLPFSNLTKKSYFYGILITLSLFGAWKHGIAREDFFHIKGLLIYTLIALIIFIVFYNKNSFRNITLLTIAFFLIAVNMTHVANYFPLKYDLFGVNNFVDFVSKFSELKSKSDSETQKNIAINKLPQVVLDSLKNKTVDVYPWDYSIVAANDLNWQPRVVIQSYAAYTSWLDKKNAAHFSSKNAPDFLIWELNASMDVNGSDFNSIDNRYLLNDEPKTIIQILQNYSLYFQNNDFFIFKKKKNPDISFHSIIKKGNTHWEEWNSVPEISDGLLRLKVYLRKSIIERIKSFLFKDEQIWVYMKLSNQAIHKYRIIPENAKDGIWINPYIFNATNNIDAQVKQILLKSSNNTIMDNNISFEWEKIDFNDPEYVVNFWGKTKSVKDSIYLYSINDFEKSEIKFWSKSDEKQISKKEYFSESNSQSVEAKSFSSAFSFPLDSLPYNNYRITFDCEAKSNNYIYSRDISLVLSVDDISGHIIWKGTSVDEQLIDQNHWNNILNVINYNHSKSGCTLHAYIWNSGNKHILIDNLRVVITGNKKN